MVRVDTIMVREAGVREGIRMIRSKQARDENPSLFGVRHRTAREAVVASQRGRVLEAMVKSVAEKGYAATAIADVVAAAAVSRRTFYEHFRDKEECFLAAFETGLRFLFSRVEQESAGLEPGDWQGRLRVLLETYLATLASEPEFTKVLHVDTLAAGEQARARWAGLLQRLVAFYRSLNQIARGQDPAIPEVSDEVLLVLLGGILEVVREYVRTARVERLPELAPELTTLAVAIVSGAGQGTGAAGRAPRARSAKSGAGARSSG
jgi:AcrR family transcriptional regulator